MVLGEPVPQVDAMEGGRARLGSRRPQLAALCVRAQQQPPSLLGSPGLALPSRESSCSEMTSSEIFHNKEIASWEEAAPRSGNLWIKAEFRKLSSGM